MVISILFTVAFAAMQGAVVWATARAGLQHLKMSHWLAKTVAMAISYAGWATFTFMGFVLLGADIFIVPFGLSLIALISSFVYLVGWILVGTKDAAPDFGTKPLP